MKPTIEAFQIGPKRHGHFRSPLTGVDLTDCSYAELRHVACSASDVAATIGAMRPNPAELEVLARAL